eukprot:TRINITY_DN59973_c0_g1_i1.p1 TRINITY_DN59973_c0_g1~~TRINITY_DN59973_c0_g1_i1.p1  ORF type:complete len:366 (-),score=90.28 TRINITY_DN59973_c0_g1_i1:90-1187(-)
MDVAAEVEKLWLIRRAMVQALFARGYVHPALWAQRLEDLSKMFRAVQSAGGSCEHCFSLFCQPANVEQQLLLFLHQGSEAVQSAVIVKLATLVSRFRIHKVVIVAQSGLSTPALEKVKQASGQTEFAVDVEVILESQLRLNEAKAAEFTYAYKPADEMSELASSYAQHEADMAAEFLEVEATEQEQSEEPEESESTDDCDIELSGMRHGSAMIYQEAVERGQALASLASAYREGLACAESGDYRGAFQCMQKPQPDWQMALALNAKREKEMAKQQKRKEQKDKRQRAANTAKQVRIALVGKDCGASEETRGQDGKRNTEAHGKTVKEKNDASRKKSKKEAKKAVKRATKKEKKSTSKLLGDISDQ